MVEVVRAAGIVGFRRLVTELGGNPAIILARANLDDSVFAQPDRYISYRSVLLAIEDAALVLGVPDFGLRLAAKQDIGFLGPLALAIQSARTIRDGLTVAGRHINFHTPSIALEASGPDGSGHEIFQLHFRLRNMHEIPQATEHGIAHLCKLVRVLSDDRVHPAAIHFRHERIGTEAQYEQHLGQLPRFGSSFDGIAMRTAEVRLGVASTNSQMQGFVERYLVGVAPPFDISLTEQVRETLRNLSRVRQPNLGDVSRVLRMQPRTLQRRLKDAGERFEVLQDEVRREEAEVLFRQPALPLSVVAQTLGFNDQAALNRACRRWFGITPRQKRRASIGASTVLPEQ